MNQEKRVLYNYFRSSASYRVRIAMSLKGLPFEYESVHLNRNGGEQYQPGFKTINSHALVPVLRNGDFQVSQSLAILEYLEEKYPEVPLLPQSVEDRAYVRQLALAIACDMHPLNNLRVLKYLTGPMGLADDAKMRWVRHWITTGLAALETELKASGRAGRFCLGDQPTLADVCLVPQLFSGQRFDVDLANYPLLSQIDAACQELPAFYDAHPGRQPDSE